jgi:predicted MFS family arabinose efflux permease
MAEVSQDITAVLAALNFRDSRREALRAVTDSEWKGLLSRWRILHLMIPLRQVCGGELPGWVRSQLDQNLANNAERFRNIQVVYSEFADALRAKNLEHLVIKGFAQSPDFVEHPRLRFQGDIDVYCPPESIFPVRDALLALGYQPVKETKQGSADHLPAMMRETDWKWRGNFYDPEMPLVFELHFCFWNEKRARFGPSELDLFWDRRVQRRIGDFSFPALAPVDNLGYFALHVLRDLLSGERIAYNVYELARYLHTNADNEVFWRNWRELHNASLRSLEAISFRLASEWFSCDLSQQVEREIDCLPNPVQSWFETCGQYARRSWIRPNKAGLWLQLSLVESWRDKSAIFRRTLFPTQMPSAEIANAQATVLDEQPKRRTPLQRRANHAGYVISRAAYHASILPSTLWQGLSWWFASKKMNKGFWTFLGASLLFGLGLAIFFFLYNLYLVDLGFKESFLGLVATSMSVGTVAGTLPAGLLTQRLGLRKTLLLGFALMAIVSALRCLVVSEASLLFLAFLGGAAFSIWAVSISPAIAQLTSEQSRSFGFSVVFSSGIAIGFLGGLTGGFLPGWLAHMGPRVVAVQAKQGALLIAAAIEVLAMWPVSRLRFVATPAPERKIFARNPFLLRFLPAIAAWSLVVGAFGPFVNVYFTQHLRLPLKQTGMVFSISQISTVVAVLAAPAIFRKFGLVTGIMYTQIATAIALGFLALVPGASSAAIVYIVYAAFLWMGEPGMFSLLMGSVHPDERAGASALNFLVISLVQAGAVAATGASLTRFGYPAVLGTTAVVALIAAVVFWLLLGNHSLWTNKPTLQSKTLDQPL